MASGKIHNFPSNPPMGQIPYKPQPGAMGGSAAFDAGPQVKQPYVAEGQFGGPAMAGSGVGSVGLTGAQVQANTPGVQAPKQPPAPVEGPGFFGHVKSAAKRVPWWGWVAIGAGVAWTVHRKRAGKPVLPSFAAAEAKANGKAAKKSASEDGDAS